MDNASRDQNFVTTLLAVSSVDGVTPVTLYANPTTHRLLVDLAGGGSGTVQTVAIATANGFAGTSDGNPSAPTITLTTSVTGILKGNGTAISAITVGSGLSYDGTTLSATGGGTGTVTSVSGVADRITITGTATINPTVDIASTYVGQTSITTLGTIATGTWNATAIAVNKIAAITASRAVVSDGSGFISAATTTSTEIGYVNGVTSAIQTQLNAKQATITFGTGVQTALGVNIGAAGAPVLFNGALGTPSSGTVTNLTGTASININGTVGATTPNTVVGTTITANTNLNLNAQTASTIAILDASKNIISATTATYPSLTELSYVKGVTSAIQTQINALPTASSTTTFTNKRITKRTGTTTSSATPTINTDNVDEYYITAQTVDITSFTTNLSGTPTLGQMLFISVIGTAARAITWGASFGNGPVALPTTTVTTTELSVLFKWDGSVWRCYASGSRV